MTNSLASSLSSLDIQGLDEDFDDDSSSSSNSTSSDHCARWEKAEAADGRPGKPARQVSDKDLSFNGDDSDSSCSTLLTEDSSTSLTFSSAVAMAVFEEIRPPQQAVARSLSSDNLPQMPRRQNSGRQLMPASLRRPVRTLSPMRPKRGGKRSGPPSIPRRQASGTKDKLVKSASMPMRPTRCPSFKNCVGSAA